MSKVLIVSDRPETLQMVPALQKDERTVVQAGGVGEARQEIAKSQFDAILTEDQLRDGHGSDVLASAQQADADVSVLLLSSANTAGLAASSIPRGFADFLLKPVSPELLRLVTQRACERTTMLRENSRLKAQVNRLDGQADPMSLKWIEELPPSFDIRTFLAAVEKSVIERTLQATRGAQAEAARRLGLSRSDLSYKLLKYELRKETTAAS